MRQHRGHVNDLVPEPGRTCARVRIERRLGEPCSLLCYSTPETILGDVRGRLSRGAVRRLLP